MMNKNDVVAVIMGGPDRLNEKFLWLLVPLLLGLCVKKATMLPK